MTDPRCPLLPDRYEPDPDSERALLGSGGMADVFRARDRLLDEQVAVKVVRREVMTTGEFRSRFEREVAVSAAVVHPNLVPVHDLGELPDGRPYLALALADAGSLLELRRRNPPWPVLRRLVDQVLAALACLHSRGILHLDVKLSNVLLRRVEGNRLHAWLSDLGLARALARREAFQGALAGTLSYMPVEVLLRRYAEIGPPSDLFAVGVLLYRLVAGANPFKENSVPAHINKRYRPPRQLPVRRGLVVPPGLEEIVLNLVQPDPRSRYDLAADVRAALAELPRLSSEAEELSPDPGSPGDRLSAPPTDMVLDDGGELSQERQETFGHVTGVPPWNRPSPGPIPFRPPPEPGRGARARASLPLFSLREVPMVGRDAERQRIWDLAREVVVDRRPRALVIRGETGVGKSRLVRSITRPLEEGGYATQVEVSFTEGGGPGDGYAGAVARLLRITDQDPRNTRSRLERWIARDERRRDSQTILEATLLQRWGQPEPDTEPAPPAVAREYLLKHLGRQAWRGFSVLVIEDCHWAASEDDGAALAASVLQLGLPVLVILTARSDRMEWEPVAMSAVRSVMALGAEEISLERIAPSQMAELVEECLTLEESLAAEVVRRSEGNPLFARELIGQWCQQGALRPDAPGLRPPPPGHEVRFVLEAPDEDSIPEDIRALLAGRLSNLVRHTRNAARVGDALDIVGVAGAGVPWGVLQRAAGEGLEELVDAGLVVNRRGVVAIDHPLMGQLLRERVQGADATRAHVALAEAWSEVATDFRGHLEIGRHLLAAGQHEPAVEPLTIAVEGLRYAGTVAELRSAALSLNRATGGAGRTDRPWYLAQLALARAELGVGTRQKALERIEYLLSLDPGGGIAVEVAAQYVDTLEYEARARLGLPALEAVESELDSVSNHIRALFYKAQATCLLHLKRTGPAERPIRKALDLAQGRVLRAELLLQLGRCLDTTDLDQAIQHAGEAEYIASRIGYRSLQAEALAVKAWALGAQGRWEEGRAMAEEAERIALAIGFHTHVPLCRNARAECLRFQGRLREAETLYREGRGWAAATGQQAWTFVFDLNLALCSLLQGKLTPFRERLDTINRDADPKWEPFAPVVSALEAVWAVLMGAGEQVVQAVPLDRVFLQGLDGALILSILVRACRDRGWAERAHEMETTLAQGMARRGLERDFLAPMERAYDHAMER